MLILCVCACVMCRVSNTSVKVAGGAHKVSLCICATVQQKWQWFNEFKLFLNLIKEFSECHINQQVKSELLREGNKGHLYLFLSFFVN